MIGKTNALSGGGGGDNRFTKYHVEQIITDNKCVLNITDYSGQATNNYYIVIVEDNNTQKLFLFE